MLVFHIVFRVFSITFGIHSIFVIHSTAGSSPVIRCPDISVTVT